MIKLLSRVELENLNTKRLLSYKNKLMQVPENENWDEPDARLSKSNPVWQECYKTVKEILATREHVE